MGVNGCVYGCVRVYVCVKVGVVVCVYICTYVCASVCVCVCVYMYCMYVCMYVCMYYVCMYCMYCMYVCMYVCVYICLYYGCMYSCVLYWTDRQMDNFDASFARVFFIMRRRRTQAASVNNIYELACVSVCVRLCVSCMCVWTLCGQHLPLNWRGGRFFSIHHLPHGAGVEKKKEQQNELLGRGGREEGGQHLPGGAKKSGFGLEKWRKED
ncbi:hypothetical protein Btru_001897 [Bulinus truncatus]|nr:hypothetical protein Btru_001897 [Bulinus truncatus]